jgi:hypothetical protein
VGAMILYVASVAAVVVGTATTSPVQIQCVQQAAPESWMRWLLPTIIQTVVSLASIGAGVGIAVWSFRRNRESEQNQWVRNQRAAHIQWIRDQRKAEWGALIRGLADAYNYFSHFSEESKIESLLKNEKAILRALDEVSMPFVFIIEALREIEYFILLKNFQSRVEKCCIEIRNYQDAYRANPGLSAECSLENRLEYAFYPLEKEFFDLLVATQRFAEADVRIAPAETAAVTSLQVKVSE